MMILVVPSTLGLDPLFCRINIASGGHDEDALLGYRTTERVFLDGSYWSEKEKLLKEETNEHDQKQQAAKEELARLFLDMDELSSEDI